MEVIYTDMTESVRNQMQHKSISPIIEKFDNKVPDIITPYRSRRDKLLEQNTPT